MKNLIFWSWINLEAPEKNKATKLGIPRLVLGCLGTFKPKNSFHNPKWSFVYFLDLSQRLFINFFESKEQRVTPQKVGHRYYKKSFKK